MSKALLAATALLLAPASTGAERLRGNGLMMSTTDPADPKDPKDIKEKWDKMDDFLGVMFEIACKWKHGKDVNGAAAEAVKNDGANAKAFKTDLQADNVQSLKRACGMIVAKGKKNCRQSCADRWGKDLETRSSCDGKCVRAYDNFDSQCTMKADNLAKVYSMKLNAADARKQCMEGHCERFPTVWLKDNKTDMDAEVTTRCDSYCAAGEIEKRCKTKWVLQVDFITGDIAEECFKNSTSASDCFKGNKTKISTAMDTCQSDGTTTCGTQHTNCTTEGNTSNTFKDAKGFCDDRKKMCKDQVNKKCLADHKADLSEAQANCTKAQDDEVASCEATTLTSRENSTVETCKTDDVPVCKKDCSGLCKVDKMKTCLTNLESKHDPAADFCKDFWTLLHESSEIDPESGQPIVLMSSKANVTSSFYLPDSEA